MKISKRIDSMIDGLEKKKQKPEYIIMGKNLCASWLIELSGGSDFTYHPKVKRYNFKYKTIPIVVCESEILEVVPNAKILLNEM